MYFDDGRACSSCKPNILEFFFSALESSSTPLIEPYVLKVQGDAEYLAVLMPLRVELVPASRPDETRDADGATLGLLGTLKMSRESLVLVVSTIGELEVPTASAAAGFAIRRRVKLGLSAIVAPLRGAPSPSRGRVGS